MTSNSHYSWLNLTANGNVRPCRVVTGVTGAGNALKAVEAAVAGTIPGLGLAREHVRYRPGSAEDDGYIAIAGESLSIVGPGEEGNALAGAAITNASLPLTFDNQGRVISLPTTAATTFWCIGFPRHTALAAGDKVSVLVTTPFAVTNPA